MKKQMSSKAPIVAGWVSLISNIVLTIIKIVVGTIFRSPVLLADGYHNAGDVVASAAALTSMRISQRQLMKMILMVMGKQRSLVLPLWPLF